MADPKATAGEAPLTAQEAAAYLNAIVESSDDAIVGKDLNGIIKSWNRGAERIFGYKAEEAVGKSILMIIPEDRQSEEDVVLANVRAGLRVDHFETQRVRKDGSMVDISLTVSPIKDQTGRIVGASKIARDISDRRKAERLSDQFLSLISHEMRTPLAIISGVASLLQTSSKKMREPDRVELIDDLVNESHRLQRIIENLLLLTKLEAQGIELEPVHLAHLVNESVLAFTQRHRDSNVAAKIEPHIPVVSGNPTYIDLVMANLLSNAEKYSPPRSSIEVVARYNGRAEVCVLDHGIGFSPDEEGQLFTPFYRSSAARSTASGMGIGLAVCKQVIEAQGGTIWAKPRPGGGTEFGFSLPEAEVASA